MRTDETCIFCGIADGTHISSIVHEDDAVVAFMDRFPLTAGHLLVIPRSHSVGLEDTDVAIGQRVWAVAQRLAGATRSSELEPAGVNLLLCDGVTADQTVFHLHLHVIPRYPDDNGWTLAHGVAEEQSRATLDAHAAMIRDALR